MIPLIEQARKNFHIAVTDRLLCFNKSGVPSNSDKDNAASVLFARGIAERIGAIRVCDRLPAQTLGNEFERCCLAFVQETFLSLGNLRPGKWEVRQSSGRKRNAIAEFEQYAHLIALEEAARNHPGLASILGSDYTIAPDIVIARLPECDEVINSEGLLVGDHAALSSPLRSRNNTLPMLHASISCKWTIRSDRAQNSRSEALNLIRNRKGGLPHIAVITAEPTPSRLSTLALGTGDINCVYHFALNELIEAVADSKASDAQDSLSIMVEGKRLRDISDLPLDLAI